MFSGNINDKPYFIQFIQLLFIFVGSMLIGQFLIGGIFMAAGIDLKAVTELDFSKLGDKGIKVYKVAQICSSILMFIVPALIFSYLKTGNRYQYSRITEPFTPTAAGLAALSAFCALPLVGYMAELNQAISLPESLSWLEESMWQMEKKAEEMISTFLAMDNVFDLLVNLLMVAVIPAIGEELLFRGSLQRLLGDWTKKPHLAIWISAALFSFIHFQFFGFIPRMVLGAFLGYLFYWGGSLWYPIIAHLLNNGIQVFAVYLGYMNLEASGTFDEPEGVPLTAVAMGLILFSSAFVLFYKNTKGKELV